jgi:hypothetical protein
VRGDGVGQELALVGVGQREKGGKGGRPLHIESRANLGQLDRLMRRLCKDVMPKADKVALVGKRHHALAVLLRDREEEAEDVHDALAEARLKAVEDEVRVLFRDGRGRVRGNVVPEDDVVERKEDGRAVREVRDDERVYESRRANEGRMSAQNPV